MKFTASALSELFDCDHVSSPTGPRFQSQSADRGTRQPPASRSGGDSSAETLPPHEVHDDEDDELASTRIPARCSIVTRRQWHELGPVRRAPRHRTHAAQRAGS